MAINFRNTNTLEFRLWRGTLNYKTFLATLQLQQLLVDFANVSYKQQCAIPGLEDFVKRAEQLGYTEFLSYMTTKGFIATNNNNQTTESEVM